jgi:hypothetical protein
MVRFIGALPRSRRTSDRKGYDTLAVSAASLSQAARYRAAPQLKLLHLERALPLFRIDEPPFLVDFVTLESKQD